MATVTVSKWTPFGVALDLTASNITITRKSFSQFTVHLSVSWEVSWEGAQTDYGMSVTSGGVTKTINTADGTKRSSGSGSLTGTYSVGTGYATTVPISITFKNFNYNGTKSATKTLTLNVSVPAWTSYTVKYNLNGGSGTFGNQTKWKDQTLKLHSQSPAKTGHSFSGWRASNGVLYQAGVSYTANSATTLTAEWKANTYTVKYNANNGTGAPGDQTKTYGVSLKLSTTVPTRKNYNFKGWATSASATTAQYAAGGTYNSNANIYLYAVWELAYTKPKITNFDVVRYSDGSPTGVPKDDGTYAYVSFDWSTFQTPVTIKVVQSPGNQSFTHVYTDVTSGNQLRGWGDLNPETTYTFAVTVSDGDGVSYSTTLTKTLPGTKFVIDFLVGGKGASIGKPAELEGVFEVAYETKLTGGLRYPVLEPCNLDTLLIPNTYSGRNVSDYSYVYGTDPVQPLPFTKGTFTLEVISSGPTYKNQILQRLTVCDKNNSQVYERWYYGNEWSAWTGGWINATIGSEFAMYGTDVNANQPKYRKDGRIVEVRGAVTPVNDIATGDDMHTICTLPVGYRPSSPLYLICQGSGARIWLLRVNTDGTVSFSRYRNGEIREVATPGAWLPFHCTFLAG
jgi:uncharacterized repeat protein (TIGR02543 family)